MRGTTEADDGRRVAAIAINAEAFVRDLTERAATLHEDVIDRALSIARDSVTRPAC